MRFPVFRKLPHAAAALTLALIAAGAAEGHGNRPEGAGGPGAASHENRGKHKGRPARARGVLLPPEGATDTDAWARIDVKFFPERGRRMERSWLRIKARRLDAATEYSLWADDPTVDGTDLFQFDVFTTGDEGKFNYFVDTKHGGTLPFGASLADLGGLAIEVRSADGSVTVLAGTIPDIDP